MKTYSAGGQYVYPNAESPPKRISFKIASWSFELRVLFLQINNQEISNNLRSQKLLELL
jgi:hypothetical protein